MAATRSVAVLVGSLRKGSFNRSAAVRDTRIQPLGARRPQERHRRRLAPLREERLLGKPAGVVSVSPGAISGFGANHHLRQSLVFLDVPAMAQPEAYVGGADKLFDAAGNLTNDSTKQFMAKFLEKFATWIERNAG